MLIPKQRQVCPCACPREPQRRSGGFLDTPPPTPCVGSREIRSSACDRRVNVIARAPAMRRSPRLVAGLLLLLCSSYALGQQTVYVIGPTGASCDETCTQRVRNTPPGATPAIADVPLQGRTCNTYIPQDTNPTLLQDTVQTQLGITCDTTVPDLCVTLTSISLPLKSIIHSSQLRRRPALLRMRSQRSRWQPKVRPSFRVPDVVCTYRASY